MSALSQEVADRTCREVARELSKIEPQVVIEPEFVPVENDRVVIVLSVPGDREGPYTYDGRPYVRQGPTTQSMDRSTFEQRVIENRDPRRRWEARPASGVDVGDLDASEITRTISSAIDRGRIEEPGTRDPEALLRVECLLGGAVFWGHWISGSESPVCGFPVWTQVSVSVL
jgi:ATP-dependent DNA helicase RecG